MLRHSEQLVLLSITAWLNGRTGNHTAKIETIVGKLKYSLRRLRPMLLKLHKEKWIIWEPGLGRGKITVIKMGDKLSSFFELIGGRFVVKKGDVLSASLPIKEKKTEIENYSEKAYPNSQKVEIITTIGGKPLTQKIWMWLLDKCGNNEYEAAKILYRAKTSENLEAFIRTGFQRGYINSPCKDEESNSRKVNDWIDRLLSFITENQKKEAV